MTSPALRARGFHDGELVFLNWEHEYNVVLGLLRPDDVRFDLTLKSVRGLSANGIRDSNLISNLWVVSGREPTDEELPGSSFPDVLAALLPGLHPTLEPLYRDDYDQFLDDEVQGLLNGERTLVVLECSRGAKLVALCMSAELNGPL